MNERNEKSRTSLLRGGQISFVNGIFEKLTELPSMYFEFQNAF